MLNSLQKKPLEDGSYLSWIYRRESSAKRLQAFAGKDYWIYDWASPIQRKNLLIAWLVACWILRNFRRTLAREYHQRWEVENTIDELKIHLVGRKLTFVPKKPREVVQEVYGWLLGHWAVRFVNVQAATSVGVPPLRLSFTELRVIPCPSQSSTP